MGHLTSLTSALTRGPEKIPVSRNSCWLGAGGQQLPEGLIVSFSSVHSYSGKDPGCLGENWEKDWGYKFP